MPNTYSEIKDFVCPECGTPFTSRVWLIIDVEEQPDLLERAKAGELLAAACPGCGARLDTGSPLLIYFPEEVPRVILATGTKAEPTLEERAQVVTILDRLQRSSQDEDLLSHLDEPGDWVRKSALASRLEGYPERPLEVNREGLPENLRNLGEENPELFLLTALEAYLNASGLEEKARVVSYAPELLTEEIDPHFERMVAELEEEGSEWQRMIYQAQWDFLRRAREIGYDRAVEEYQNDLWEGE